MSQGKQYKRSPLTEAVIDLRVVLPDRVTLSTLSQLRVGQEKDYPRLRDRSFVRGQFSLDPGMPVATGSRTHVGYDFVSVDERQIVQVRQDGFTFSRLNPYESWDSFRNEARRWWNIYRTETNPETIGRAAVRYINRLDLPLPLGDFEDYLRTVPKVSADLPQGLAGYFMQLQVPQEDLGAMLVLNEAIAPPSRPEVVSVILDIDLFRDTDVPQEEEVLWEFLEKLRLRKNEVFEACITEKTRELIA